MYIGKLGDGSSPDDGIYVLLKEVLDNAIDEFSMGVGDTIEVKIDNNRVIIRDYGRGIPLEKVVDAASKMNTGAKYDSKVFKKSVGLNGVGIKAVNALSEKFLIKSYRDGLYKRAEFSKGRILIDAELTKTNENNGVYVEFCPDNKLFPRFSFSNEHVETMLRNYTYLHRGLTIIFNDQPFFSKDGLLDLLRENVNTKTLYPPIHLEDDDIEIALTHGEQYGEEYYSFVNGQHTVQGGTHLTAFREAIVRTIRVFFKKDFDVSDIRTSIIAAISIKIEEPIFESQTKTKLGSKNIAPNSSTTVRNFIMDFLLKNLDNYFHKNSETTDILLKKILDNERERKAISGIRKLARERSKKVNLHNKKLRDCRIHFNTNKECREDSSIFITEGDSASGSITISRNVDTQAVFSLKGKPLNTYNRTKKVVYENEEFNLLQAALNIEKGIENLRYNKVIIATDADVDGMHIRLLLLTFFMQFFPELIRKRHLYILQTPLFRVRNKKSTLYCYNEGEKLKAIKKLGKLSEVTRFKGLGEISPKEFGHFIGDDIKLELVQMGKNESTADILEFYMGKNTLDRQNFIINNLQIEIDTVSLKAEK